MKFLPLTAVLLLAVLAAVTALPQPERRDPSAEVAAPDVAEEKPAVEDPAGDNDDDEDSDDDEDRQKRWGYVYYKDDQNNEPKNFLSEGGTGKAGGCSTKYRVLKNSTMCAFQDDNSVTQWGMSKAEKNEFVNMHNAYRAKENAKDMLKVYWDNKLATLAQKLAQSCHYGHDSEDNRYEPDYKYSGGQNFCTASSAKTCVDMWFGEKKVWRFDGPNNFDKVGHFTQGALSMVVALGCGHAKCENGRQDVYVCNYSRFQNIYDVDTPYHKGTKCAMCPGKCKGNLCDCGKKMCKNGGTINVATCACDCPKPFSGSVCQNVVCNDVNQCGSGDYVKNNCSKYGNLPGLCPKMCGLC